MRVHRPISLGAVWLLLAPAIGCGDSTQLVVVVDSDYNVPGDVDVLELDVATLDGEEIKSHEWTLTSDPDVHNAGETSFPLSFGILAFEGEPSRRVRIRVSASKDFSSRQTVEASSDFVTDKRLLLNLFIAKACEDVRCGDGETCSKNGCEPITKRGASLPFIDGGDEFEPAGGGGGGVGDCSSNPNACFEGQRIGAAPGCACEQGCQDGLLLFRGACVPAYSNSDLFDVDTMIGRWVDGQCAYRTRCSPALYDFKRETERDCRLELSVLYANRWYAYAESVSNGTLRFNQANFNACVSDLEGGQCQSPSPNACNFMFVGDKTEGDVCSLGEECGRGTWCNVRGTAVCGSCELRVGLGERCETLLCDRGLTCATSNNEKFCVRLRTVGESCGRLDTGLCGNRLQCVESTCRVPSDVGEACDSSLSSNSSCDIFQHGTCVNGVCRFTNFNPPGGTCNDGANACDNRSSCNSGANRCDTLPTAGQVCNSGGVCAPGHFCSQDECNALIPAGQSCNLWGTCEPTSYCRGPDPQSTTCGRYNWARCD